jgi:uncharacterized protein (DUF2235 family)
MANVIVCCDGTWNTADERDSGVPSPTNVAKIYNAIAKTDTQGAEQRAYYHSGVGTEGNRLEKFLGGALGDGLEKNVKSAYKWLAQNYHPGDKIYIFGFSRGAYTARYVAGMICSFGLADFSSTNPSDDEMWKGVDRVYEADRANAEPMTIADITFFNTPAGQSPKDTTPIQLLGVWDTVGALGIPSDMALLKLLDDVDAHQFQDAVLSNTVLHARHALAIDEQRESFTPTLWANADKHPDAKQIWFAGVHSDVGGGYIQTGLSDIALNWMMDEAKALGLNFRAGIFNQLSPDPQGILHDSCTGVFGALRTLPRGVPLVTGSGPSTSAFHPSVISRSSNPPIEQSPYWETTVLPVGASTAVDVFARPHWNATGVYLEKGVEYAFEASGQWIDSTIKCSPSGNTDAEFHFGDILQLAGSALGKAEKLYQTLAGNEQADFWGTKRVEEYDWFALVGVIANGTGTDVDGNPIPHETFLIGDGVPSYRPRESGYLYCFANDAWQTYGNNRGSVRLTVKRLAVGA